eukprot:3863436-Prymnesium_polylepis.1
MGLRASAHLYFEREEVECSCPCPPMCGDEIAASDRHRTSVRCNPRTVLSASAGGGGGLGRAKPSPIRG